MKLVVALAIFLLVLVSSYITFEDKKVEIKIYDAEHAFANPSNPKHNKEFADDAMKFIGGILKNQLVIFY